MEKEKERSSFFELGAWLASVVFAPDFNDRPRKIWVEYWGADGTLKRGSRIVKNQVTAKAWSNYFRRNPDRGCRVYACQVLPMPK